MAFRLSGKPVLAVFMAVGFLTLVQPGFAQGQAEAPKPTPMTSDGHPDLNGFWVAGRGAAAGAGAPGGPVPAGGAQNVAKDNGHKEILFNEGGRAEKPIVQQRVVSDYHPPYKPELMAKMRNLEQNENKMDPAFFCKPEGVPRMGAPNAIYQIPGRPIVFLYEALSGNTFRIIPTDGRGHDPNSDASYFGDSVGKWEGNTLVIDSLNFTDDTWLGIDGWFHTTAMQVTERFTRIGDQLKYEVTVDDPQAFTGPWQMRTRNLRLDPRGEIIETAPCVERDENHLVNSDHH